jgi:hypothetical protein
MTNIESIAGLENALKNDATFQREWSLYIESAVANELKKRGIKHKKIKKIKSGIARRILRMFDWRWWEMYMSHIAKIKDSRLRLKVDVDEWIERQLTGNPTVKRHFQVLDDIYTKEKVEAEERELYEKLKSKYEK